MASVAAAKTLTASNVVVVIVAVMEELCRFEEDGEVVVNVMGGVLLRDLGGGRGCWPLSSITSVKEVKVD